MPRDDKLQLNDGQLERSVECLCSHLDQTGMDVFSDILNFHVVQNNLLINENFDLDELLIIKPIYCDLTLRFQLSF